MLPSVVGTEAATPCSQKEPDEPIYKACFPSQAGLQVSDRLHRIPRPGDGTSEGRCFRPCPKPLSCCYAAAASFAPMECGVVHPHAMQSAVLGDSHADGQDDALTVQWASLYQKCLQNLRGYIYRESRSLWRNSSSWRFQDRAQSPIPCVHSRALRFFVPIPQISAQSLRTAPRCFPGDF
jgi:hypothetical protein